MKKAATSQAKASAATGSPSPIYVVSGGVGASGEQLVNTALAQFPKNDVPVITVGNVRQVAQLKQVVKEARNSGGTIAHTLVDARLRDTLIALADKQAVVAIDLMGPMLNRLAEVVGAEPLGRPGLYRQFHRAYFDRVAAIEYTLKHDDGQNPRGWPQADFLLLGVSRTGKTPLSVYLSILGYKVANLPLILERPTPPALFRLNRRRVVGLTIRPDQLIIFREQRYSQLGVLPPFDYVDLSKVREEVRAALMLYQRGGFAVIDVTDKPIEASADEIIKLINQPSKARRTGGARPRRS
jgi:regulator of PEP synthase PpsR (kinase-PPPase family)